MMPRIMAPRNAYTSIPDTGGSAILEARFGGAYVHTDGTQPADPTEGYALADGLTLVVPAGLTIFIYPINNRNNGEDLEFFYHPFGA